MTADCEKQGSKIDEGERLLRECAGGERDNASLSLTTHVVSSMTTGETIRTKDERDRGERQRREASRTKG